MNERQELSSAMLADADFRRLRARKNAVSAALTAITLVIYFGFIFLIAYDKEFVSMKVYGSVSLGVPLGLGVIAASWLLTGIYALWANTVYDSMVNRLKDRMGG